MRKVVYLVASSLDGKIAKEDGGFDCFPMEGEHVTEYLTSLKDFDDVLMGRNTYEVGTKVGLTNPYPSMRGHVFSQSMEKSPDANVRLVKDDAAEYVRTLKNQPGRDIYLCGGGALAARLLEEKLIDELAIKLNPLLIGPGIPLFTKVKEPLLLKLISSKVYDSGVLLLRYQVN